jgi:hypothetical protein
MTESIAPIRARRSVIQRELARLEDELVRLREEDVRLATAEAVFEEYGVNLAPQTTKRRAGGKKKKEARIKPEGIPTMPEMIVGALRDAFDRGKPWLQAHEIRDFISQRWWKEVDLNAVGPIVWRMATKDKTKIVVRTDAGYALAKAIGASAGETAEAPRPGPGGNGAAHPSSPHPTGVAEGRVMLSG